MTSRSGASASWWLRLILVATAGAAIGCGGGKGSADAAGGQGVGGDAGSTGAGGSGGVSGTSCAVGERAPDLQDCTEFDNVANDVTAEPVVPGDGGIYLPGGELAVPMGGTLVDGDYRLVRAVWNAPGTTTRRTIRLSNAGTYTEWVIDQDQDSLDGGIMHYRINAPVTRSGNFLNVDAYSCSGSLTDSFGFTASGDQLILFNFNNPGMFVYQRTCVRR